MHCWCAGLTDGMPGCEAVFSEENIENMRWDVGLEKELAQTIMQLCPHHPPKPGFSGLFGGRRRPMPWRLPGSSHAD